MNIIINVHYNYISNPLPPNDIYTYMYMCVRACVCVCTAQLTSRRYILNIYSTNILTEYFKNAGHSPFFSFKMPFYFIMVPFFGSCNIHKFKYRVCQNLKENSGAKGLMPSIIIIFIIKASSRNAIRKKMWQCLGTAATSCLKGRQ